MGLICFVLDLPSFQPSLLKDLKQCLLELGNLYALRKYSEQVQKFSTDSIALCCIEKNNAKGSNELRVAYRPRETFNLRDFHHAVNSLSTEHLLPRLNAFDFPEIHQQVSCLSTLLTSEGELCSWGPQTIGRKVIMISSFFMESVVSFKKTVLDAADHFVPIEFIQIKSEIHQHVQWGNFRESMLLEKNKDFTSSIIEFENCMFRRVERDCWSLYSLVKQWLQDIKDEREEPLQAVFLFKDNVVESTNKIFCNLFPSTMQIEDKFSPCQVFGTLFFSEIGPTLKYRNLLVQTCRCHGATVDTVNAVKQRDVKSVCPITGHELDPYDLTENGLKIGSGTLLLLPSFKKIPKLESICTTVVFNIIECIRLDSLCEGLFFGLSFVVLPSFNHDMDVQIEDRDKRQSNHQIFSGLCQVLDTINCGLICSSTCDIEYKFEVTLPCFYLLQPSDNGRMLLRRIAASEELLPFPDPVEEMITDVSEELKVSIHSSLTKMGFQNYNPLNHERGCHTKLNWLVKESLQFRSTPMPTSKPLGEQNLPVSTNRAKQGNLPSDNMRKTHEKMNMSPGHLAKKQLPSILERIEPLRTFNKLNIHSPPLPFEAASQSSNCSQHIQAHSGSQSSKALMGMKKPLLPLHSSHLPKPSQSATATPQLKPNFRRIKRTKN